jgi:Protein of unknown function (DUF4242)
MIELYVSRIDSDSVARAAERARLAANAMTREGTPVRYLRSMHVLTDETCFLLFEAESVDVVRELARSALLPVEHVVEVVEEELA